MRHRRLQDDEMNGYVHGQKREANTTQILVRYT